MGQLPKLNIESLEKINLRHLFVLSDDTAILQHASRSTPNLHHGYCTDDTARALIATVKLLALPQELWTDPEGGTPGPHEVVVATQRYLAFLAYAFNPEVGRFRNFMQYDRSWMEEVGSEDSHARTVWALGKTIRLAPNEDICHLANELMLNSLPVVKDFEYIRPVAYSLLGIEEYLQVNPEQELARELRGKLINRLFEVYKAGADDEWPWWEDELTWGNAKLPHAMMVAGAASGRQDIVDAALKALRWLLEVQTADKGHLSIIGNRGWMYRGKEKAEYDQQPIEAKALVQACLAAAAITGDDFWCEQAKVCFDWFTGSNDLGVSLYNPETGGCFDGLMPAGVNRNQGAESTLAYLMSLLEMHLYDLASQGKDEFTPALDFE